MTNIEQRALSSMNYIFLRAATDKELYPESVTEELSYFLSGLAKDLDEDAHHFSIILRHVLKDYIYQELNESDYLVSGYDASKFVKNIRSFCYRHLDLDDHEIRVICDYYQSIAEEVLEKWHEQER